MADTCDRLAGTAGRRRKVVAAPGWRQGRHTAAHALEPMCMDSGSGAAAERADCPSLLVGQFGPLLTHRLSADAGLTRMARAHTSRRRRCCTCTPPARSGPRTLAPG